MGHGADRERWEGPLSQCGIAHAVGSVAPLVGGVPVSEGPQSQPAHHGWAVSQPADRCGHRPLAWRAPHRSWMLCQKRSYLVLYDADALTTELQARLGLHHSRARVYRVQSRT